MKKINRKSGLVVFLAALLSACGGGGSGDSASVPDPSLAPTPAAPPTTGIEGSGVALGTISGFGSVIVNGVRYNTDNAQITVDSQSAMQSDLSIGDVVVIVGTIDADGANGTAESVRLDHVLEGPVSAVDPTAGTFVVFEQTVRVDNDTVFDDGLLGSGIDAITVGQRVEISGFFTANGGIVATRIEAGDANDELELSGVVSALDTSASTFAINGQVVDYATAVLEDFPAGGIANGQLVEVYASDTDSNGRLTATRVENYDALDNFDDGDELEIEGFVSRFASATDFDVAGLPVTTTGDTEYENGTAASLAVDVRVEVEGELDDNGVLVAEEIEFLTLPAASLTELSGLVEAVDDTSLTVLGLVIGVDERTSFEDNSDADVTNFGLADIRVGDFVEVRAGQTNAGLVARRIERDDDDDDGDDTELVGAVDSVMDPTLVVQGVTVETDSATLFFDEDTRVTAAEFFMRVEPGRIVEVEGQTISAGVILAEKIELEDDDD